MFRSLTLAVLVLAAAFAVITPATAGGGVKCDPCDRLERIERKLDALKARRHIRHPAPRAYKARTYSPRPAQGLCSPVGGRNGAGFTTNAGSRTLRVTAGYLFKNQGQAAAYAACSGQHLSNYCRTHAGWWVGQVCLEGACPP